MSNTHDYDIGNAVGATFRADLNVCLSEIQSTNRGSSEPTTKVNGKLWVNSSNNTLNIYDGTNFINLGKVDTAEMGHATTASPSFTGTITSAGDIVMSGNGSLQLPTGTTAQRPTPSTGDIRFNTSLTQFEGYNGSVWGEIANGVPAGSIFTFASTTVPSGYLECNGSAVSRSTYSSLFTAIGTTHGSGDGSSTFNLPDLRGEFVRGWDHNRGVDSGRSFASSQSDQNESHNHSLTDPNHAHTQRGLALNGGSGSVAITLGSGQSYQIGYSGSQSSVTTGSSSTGISLGSSGGNESRPRNLALMYVIKF
tara:strand:- start:695 stop:1621 length:927 start_codon:yes stop_codon:yes gene_type:complete